MTKYLKAGNTFKVFNDKALNVQNKLPVATYTVKFDEQAGQFFLEQIEPFKLPTKLYGSLSDKTDRILTSFAARSGSTGVLLSGEKGSGKTLLAKNLSVEAGLIGIPTIVVNEQFYGSLFNEFIQNVSQDCVVLFDEFEKVYENNHQEQLLTLLDGVYPSKKMFILTCNDHYRVDSHMRNRPGRLFYAIKYKGLDAKFILDYCDDQLDNMEHAETIAKISMVFDSFNFDMLQALVEEMNRYEESPSEAMEMLNINPESGNNSEYQVSLTYNGQKIPNDMIEDTSDQGVITCNPMTGVMMTVYMDEPESETIVPIKRSAGIASNRQRLSRPDEVVLMFMPEHISEVNVDSGFFKFHIPETNSTMELTRIVKTPMSWGAF